MVSDGGIFIGFLVGLTLGWMLTDYFHQRKKRREQEIKKIVQEVVRE